MVRKLFSMIEKEISSVHNAAYLLAIFAFLSQLLALIRDRLLAHTFGASSILDIYYSAFRVPDFIFSSVASLVSIAVLIPFLADRLKKGEENEESKTFINTVFSSYMIMMVLVSALAYALMPYLSHIILPTLANESLRPQFILISRILLIQPVALGISNLLGSITQVTKRFFLFALSPLFYNGAIIFGIVALAPHFGLDGIVAGVVLGSILHFAIQIPYIKSLDMLPVFTWKMHMEKLKKVARLSFPRTLTLSLNSLELIFITSYASFMTAGSISIFNLSLNLQSVPFAIIGVSYSLAAFPTLSKLFSSGQRAKFGEHLEVAARHIIFWSLPVTSLFIVLRAQIVRTILGSGHFGWNDTRLTAASLALFVISLVAQGLELLFIRAYYAGSNTRKPLYINITSSFLTITLPWFFILLWKSNPVFQYFIENLFKVNDIPGSIVLTIPLGYSIGTLINMVVLWICFEMDFKMKFLTLRKTFYQSFSTAVIMGFITFLSLNALSRYLDLNTSVGIFFQGFIAGIIGILAGVGLLSLLKSPELVEIFGLIPKKIFGAKDVVLETEQIE